jgi:hypothetical protein
MRSVEDVKKLEAELARAREDAKNQLLAEGKKIVSALFQIGYEFDLVDKHLESSKTNGTTRTCSLCQKRGHTKATCPDVAAKRGASADQARA